MRPVYWRLTDAEKTRLGFELEKIPESDRFEVKIMCLPDAGSRTFVTDIAKVITDHHWKISVNCLFNRVRPDLTGFWFSVSKVHAGKNINDLPKDMRTFLGILNAASIQGQGIAYEENLKDDEFYLVAGNAP